MAKPSKEKESRLTADEARRVLSYDSATGVLRWKVSFSSRNPIGSEAGCVGGNPIQYRTVSVMSNLYSAHRVIVLIMTGSWPPDYVDHINGDSTDNRWCNIRCVSHADNMRNKKMRSDNTSGHVGVTWSKHVAKWRASIFHKGKTYFLGHFAERHDAVAARESASRRFGFHENHGQRRSG